MLTKAQRARLEKLATYLESLPRNYEHFDMTDYMGEYTEKVLKYARKNGGVPQCGTVACAVGHGPAAGILVPPRMIYKNVFGKLNVNWSDYTELFVGSSFDNNFEWCFGSSWKHADNSHYGAAARIRYLLDYGAPPIGFSRPHGAYRPSYAPYRIDAKASA